MKISYGENRDSNRLTKEVKLLNNNKEMNDKKESDDGSIPPLVERCFFSNDDNESKTNDGNKGISMPCLIDFNEFGYIDTDSEDNSVHLDQACWIQANDSSENSSVGIKSNGSWDVLPALVALDQPLNQPDNGDNKIDNNEDDGENNNGSIDPFLVNIIINPPAPNLNNDGSFDSMVENSDASLPYNNVVGHKNYPNTPREWDIVERNDDDKVLYCSIFFSMATAHINQPSIVSKNERGKWEY